MAFDERKDKELKLEILTEAPLLLDGSRSLMRFEGRDILRMTENGPRFSGVVDYANIAPAGGWAGSVNERGEVEFTAQAGSDGINAVDRFISKNNIWYPTSTIAGEKRKAYIISMYGQSNADVSGMDDPLPWIYTPMKHHVLTFDDVSGQRGGVKGWIGAPVPKGPKTLVPVKQDAWVNSTMHSYAATAASRLGQLLGGNYPVFSVRSSAIGGHRLIGVEPKQGIWKDSLGDYPICWNNWTADIQSAYDALMSLEYEIAGIFIFFTHQEADWLTSRSDYSTNLQQMMDEREALIAADIPGIPVHWFVDQASGSGHRPRAFRGGAWESRLGIVDVAEARDNVTMVMPRYHMTFGMNGGILENIHHGYDSRTCPQGETYAYAMREHIKGRSWKCPRMNAAIVSGNTIKVSFDSLEPIVIDWTFCKTRPDGGFKIGDGSIAVESLTQTGQREITIQCSADPTGELLSYAWRTMDEQDVPDTWALSTGAIRDGFEVPSLFLSGKKVLRPALGYTIQL